MTMPQTGSRDCVQTLAIPVSDGLLKASLYPHASSALPPLILVHGWCGNRTFWEPQARHESQQRAVLSLDLAGHGESRIDRNNWSIRRFAEDLVSVLKHLNWHNAILLGHSMGGAVCSETAALCPERVRAVILGDTFVFDYGQFSAEERTSTLHGFQSDLPTAINKLVQGTTPEGTSTELRQHISASMALSPAEMALPAFASLLEWNPIPLWPRLSCPVLAINGDLINPAARERYAHVIQEWLLPGTGHFLQMEQPERFNATLDQALATLL